MIQTLLQTIRVAQTEYISTFGADAWRKAVAHAQHNCSLSPAYTPKAASPQAPPSQSPQRDSSPANSPEADSANPRTGVQNRKAHPTTSSSPASRRSHTNPQPQPPPSNPTASPVAAEQQPPPPPAHRQPETVAAALAVARSLFPPRPQSHAPVCQTSTTV